MRDDDGVMWQEIRIAEHERDALMVLRRLVQRAMKDEPPDSEVWNNGAGRVDPEDVLFDLDCLIADFDIATAYEEEMGSDGGGT